jgi:hypothetical protein
MALAQSSGNNKQVAAAKKEVRTCLKDASEPNWKIEASVSTVAACFAGGFLHEVNFSKRYDCKPNQICPRVPEYLVATVTFDCDGTISSAQCHFNTCDDTSHCNSDSWCRPTEEGHSESAPYDEEGDTCGGYVLPWYYEQCDPSLQCVTSPIIPDLPGECATCNYNGTPYAAGDSWTADCNTCSCTESGLVACTKVACLPAK